MDAVLPAILHEIHRFVGSLNELLCRRGNIRQRGDADRHRQRDVESIAAQEGPCGNLFADALSDELFPVRDTAIVAVKHWIGQAPERDLKFYQMLIDRKG